MTVINTERQTAWRLLLIDDDQDLAWQIGYLLDKTPLSFRLFHIDRADADLIGDRMTEIVPTAILLDHNIGSERGIDLIGGIAAHPCAAPIIALTQVDDHATIDAYLTAGAADYLVKSELTGALLERTLRYSRRLWAAHHDLLRHQAQALRQERLATLGWMAGGVAHEYNNLLASISASLELAQMHLANDNPGRVDQLLEQAVDSIQQSRQLTRQLLAARQPVQEAELTPVDLLQVARDARRWFGALCRGRGIQFTSQSSDSQLLVRASDRILDEILSNLLRNAYDALYASEVRTIELRLHAIRELVRIEIADSGPGIAAEDLGHVTRPFMSRKGPHDSGGHFDPQVSGTGLGLTRVEHLVNQLGGDLQIQSPDEGGTLVIVDLPRADATAPP